MHPFTYVRFTHKYILFLYLPIYTTATILLEKVYVFYAFLCVRVAQSDSQFYMFSTVILHVYSNLSNHRLHCRFTIEFLRARAGLTNSMRAAVKRILSNLLFICFEIYLMCVAASNARFMCARAHKYYTHYVNSHVACILRMYDTSRYCAVQFLWDAYNFNFLIVL